MERSPRNETQACHPGTLSLLVAAGAAGWALPAGGGAEPPPARAESSLKLGLLDPADGDYLLVESDPTSPEAGKFVVGSPTVGIAWGDAAGTWVTNGDSRMVDSAIFIEGVHHGSLFANATLLAHGAIGSGLGAGPILGTLAQQVFEEIVPLVGEFEFGRPALNQLAVNSSWFRWAADPDRALPEIGYYNAYGDLRITDKNCVNLVFWGDCHTADLLSLGDTIVQSGITDDPYYLDLPPFTSAWKGGGARFLRPNTTEQWQWALKREFDIKKWKMAAFTPVLGGGLEFARLVQFLWNAPELHTSIGAKANLTSITDCATGYPTNLEAQLVHIVKGKRGEETYACPLHE